MSKTNSYRQILRSSSIIGGASAINIACGLLRMKVAAVLLGPAGVGLVGLFTNILATGAGVAGLGVGTVGTRQIAEASGAEDSHRIWVVRRALFWLTIALAMIGGLLFWLFSPLLADRVLQNASLGGDLGWLSIGVVLSVAAASQNALLRGMRRVADIARISIYSALVSSAGAVIAVGAWGRSGIVPFVLAAPIASFVFGHWYVSKLPKQERARAPWSEITCQWRAMVGLGFAFMVAGLAGTVGQLVVRTLVQRELGTDALGYFQAAWVISMSYIGFVLGAMGTDYYPRLTAAIQDRLAVNRLVNEQTEVALLLAAPVLLSTLALAPWVMRVLYSAEFSGSVDVLRWQILGDLLKIISWPLGFVLLATGAGRTYVTTQWLATGVFCGVTWLMLPEMGVSAAGIGFLAMYAVLLLFNWFLAVRMTHFRWTPDVKLHAILIVASGGLINGIAIVNALVAGCVGMLLALGWAIFAIVRLAGEGGLTGSAAKAALRARALVMRLVGARRD